MGNPSVTLGNYRLRLTEEGRLRIDVRVDNYYWRQLDPVRNRRVYDEMILTVGRAWVIAAHPV